MKLFEIPSGQNFDNGDAKKILLGELQELSRFCQIGLLNISKKEALGEDGEDQRAKKYTLKTTQEIFIPMLQKLIEDADEVAIKTV